MGRQRRESVIFRLRSSVILSGGCASPRSTTAVEGSLSLPRTRALQRHCRRDEIMTWIKTVPLTEVDEKLRKAMEAQRALYHAFGTFGALMSPDLPLSRRQHEMIATMVSVTNRCVY